ncbi:MAG TPA: hypothetical protein VNG04_08540 [Candidatus Acidoferrum sp.]|nr:hypothetical protein [Candidatus Acidoferrum sp.]HXJ32332.1 hypothetical protein [Gemmatimonadales bacterium]
MSTARGISIAVNIDLVTEVCVRCDPPKRLCAACFNPTASMLNQGVA